MSADQHKRLCDNVSVTSGDLSARIAMPYSLRNLELMGVAGIDGDITVMVSANGTDFYDSDTILVRSGKLFYRQQIDCQYIKLKYLANFTGLTIDYSLTE